jgi:hypothetical protein
MELPQPPEGLTEDQASSWLEQRDRLARRGQVVLRFPQERSIGTVVLTTLARDHNSAYAQGDITVPQFTMAMLDVTEVNSDALAALSALEADGL